MSDPNQLLNQGTLALRANRCDEAIGKFESACAIAPNMAEAHRQWGIALVKTGRAVEAIEQFKTASRLQPQDAASLLGLASACQSAGNIPEAIGTYTQFVERFPQHKDVPKVRQLIALLQRPSSSLNKLARTGVAIGTTKSSLGVRADQAVASSDDYYANITQNGLFRWRPEKMPLAVWIAQGDGTPGYQTSFAAILKQAFLDWAGASGGAVKVIFVANANNANISCKWTAQVERFKNTFEAGESKLYGDRAGLVRGELVILTVPAVQHGLPENYIVDDAKMRSVALHQVGHLLGLAGHSQNPKDAMFYSAIAGQAWHNLSPRDQATIRHLYAEVSP